MEIRGTPTGGWLSAGFNPRCPNADLPPSSLHRALGIPTDYGAKRGLKPQCEATPVHRPRGRRRPAPPPAPHAAAACDACGGGARRIVLLPFPVSQRAPADGNIRRNLPPGVDGILRLVAAPGYSEHHTGRALDIGSPEHHELDETARTAAFRWLRRRACEFPPSSTRATTRTASPMNRGIGAGRERARIADSLHSDSGWGLLNLWDALHWSVARILE